MNAQEKIQAAFDMIKEHVLKGGVLVGDEDGVKQYVFGSATLTTSSVGSHIWYDHGSHLPKIELWKGGEESSNHAHMDQRRSKYPVQACTTVREILQVTR